MEIVKDDEWGLYPNFTKAEMSCKHTGLCLMTHKMMKTLQSIRRTYGKPIVISSAYRDVSHPDERNKSKPGEHTMGMAVDIKIHGEYALLLLDIALGEGIKRIGLSQKGEMVSRFIHIGIGDEAVDRFPVGIWTY